MRWLVVGLLALAACDSESPDVVDAPVSGACDAPPIGPCTGCGFADTCVLYDQESGFPSCTDYDDCIATTETCPPGSCTPACEAALCPDEWTCDPTATQFFTCTKP